MSDYHYTDGNSTVYCIKDLMYNYPEMNDSTDSTTKNKNNSKLRNGHRITYSTTKNTYF